MPQTEIAISDIVLSSRFLFAECDRRRFEALRRTAQRGATVVVATHDLSLAARYCSTVVVMHHGRIAVEGAPDVALSEAHLAKVYGIAAKSIVVDGVPVIVPMAMHDTNNKSVS